MTPEHSPGGHITGPPVIATMRVHHVDADGTRWYVDDHTSEPYRIINLDEAKRHGRIVIHRTLDHYGPGLFDAINKRCQETT